MSGFLMLFLNDAVHIYLLLIWMHRVVFLRLMSIPCLKCLLIFGRHL